MLLCKHRTSLVLTSVVGTFVVMRFYLYYFPNTDLNVIGYNIHHLFSGLLLMMLSGLVLAIFAGTSFWMNVAAFVFGVGLALAMDEWVYLIATDGSNYSYWLPVAFWGGFFMISCIVFYVVLLVFLARWKRRVRHDSE